MPDELNTRLLFDSLRAIIDQSPREELPAIIGEAAAIQAAALSRLTSPVEPPRAPEDEADELLTVSEVAELLGQKSQWVRAHQDELKARVTLPGRSVRFSRRRLESFIKRRSYG